MIYITVIIVLAIALAAALVRLARVRGGMREMARTLVERREIRRGGLRVTPDYGMGVLIDEINEILAENSRLQRQRSSHLAQLETTLGSLQEAVIVIGSDNTVLLANKALQSLFPDAKNALRQRFERIIRSAAFLEYVEAVRNGTARPQHEIAFDTADGTRWVEATGATIEPPDEPGEPWSLFVLHDITRQKKLEAVRKDFVANVSHELRTPLSLVKGCAETLVDGHREMPDADRDRFLRTIHRHSERLATLIEDLLSLSRLESANPGLNIERVSISQLLHSIADDYRARPSASAHRITADIDPAIGEAGIDAQKITQVFENLLNNALKYTPAGSTITITAKRRPAPAHEGGGNEVEVCVRDNGPGIPGADLPHMFERFYRVDKGRSRETGGTGLGLSIVKHIVQLHGGRVRVESTQGRGAAFFFTLPERK